MRLNRHLDMRDHPKYNELLVSWVAAYLTLEVLNELQWLPNVMGFKWFWTVVVQIWEFGAILSIVVLGVRYGVQYSRQSNSSRDDKTDSQS